MINPDVLNYFLVILGGFGVVWSYRCSMKEHGGKIGEFEYAAFSALWGIPIFLLFIEGMKSRPDLLEGVFQNPIAGTPIVFVMGIIVGLVGAEIAKLFIVLRNYLKSGN